MFRLAYNTNGLAHHRLEDAFALLADLGYEGVAITPDVGQLDPLRATPADVVRVRREAERRGLSLALETGARYLLDPRRKHFPTLLEDEGEDRAKRLDLLERTIEMAAELGASLVSVWAGAAPDGVTADTADTHDPDDVARAARREVLWQRLVDGVRVLMEHATVCGVGLAFEPEPGMFIERPSGFVELRRRLGVGSENLGLCLDVGHLLVTGDRPEADVVRAHQDMLVHVHLDDIANGVHEHLPFGRGDLDLRGVLQALLDIGYRGMAAVELSRDSHRGARAASEAMQSLRSALLPPPPPTR